MRPEKHEGSRTLLCMCSGTLQFLTKPSSTGLRTRLSLRCVCFGWCAKAGVGYTPRGWVCRWGWLTPTGMEGGGVGQGILVAIWDMGYSGCSRQSYKLPFTGRMLPVHLHVYLRAHSNTSPTPTSGRTSSRMQCIP